MTRKLTEGTRQCYPDLEEVERLCPPLGVVIALPWFILLFKGRGVSDAV